MARRVACSILLLAAFLWTSPAWAQTSSLAATFAAKEAALSRLATRAATLHRSRCSSLEDTTCRTSSSECPIPACGNSFEADRGFQCTTAFGADTTLCGSTCPGLVRSFNSSVMRYPSGVSQTDGDTQAFTCSTRSLDAEFSTEFNSNVLKAWSYIGHDSGSIRIYPGAAQERDSSSCTDYDARLRPWYIAGSSGPKDVVIVYDVSGSMGARLGSGTRHDATVNAIDALLGTLTQNDRVGIVKFSSTAGNVGGSTLRRATPSNVASLQSAVKATLPNGGTAFIPALTAAFDMISSTSSENENCNVVILFLTDGETSESTSAIETLIENNRNASRNARIFTYSMGSDADASRPRAMACASGGVWDAIADGVDPLTKMRGYFQFLAAGIDATTPRWSSVYTDAFGLGEMVTVARPVYDTTGGVARLVAVVGSDITMAELGEFGDSASTILAQAFERSSQCTAFNLSSCQMQYLRDLSSGYVCPSGPTIATCDAANEIVRASSCNAVSGGLNSLLCERMVDTTSRLSASPATNAEVLCCGCGGSGKGTLGSSAFSKGCWAPLYLSLAAATSLLAF